MKELAKRVREVVKNAIPEAEERVKWGNPTYTVNGKNVASIMHFSDHINLGFFLGAKLKSKRLEGTGKGLRHIKVKAVEDIDKKEFTCLLKEATVLVKRNQDRHRSCQTAAWRFVLWIMPASSNTSP